MTKRGEKELLLVQEMGKEKLILGVLWGPQEDLGISLLHISSGC